MVEIKVGDKVTPLKRPSLRGVVKKITEAYNGKKLYILDNGSMHVEGELRKDDNQ